MPKPDKYFAKFGGKPIVMIGKAGRILLVGEKDDYSVWQYCRKDVWTRQARASDLGQGAYYFRVYERDIKDDDPMPYRADLKNPRATKSTLKFDRGTIIKIALGGRVLMTKRNKGTWRYCVYIEVPSENKWKPDETEWKLKHALGSNLWHDALQAFQECVVKMQGERV